MTRPSIYWRRAVVMAATSTIGVGTLPCVGCQARPDGSKDQSRLDATAKPQPVPAKNADVQRTESYRFTSDWFSSRIGTWEIQLRQFKNQADFRYLEVGVYEGRSFFWVLENLATHPSAQLYTVDIFPEDLFSRFNENLKRSRQPKKVVVKRGLSREILKYLPEEHFDLIYIDGSHVGKEVLRDAILSWELLKSGGILVFDDYLMRPDMPIDLTPKLAIDTFLTEFGDNIELMHKGWQIMAKKRHPCSPVYEDDVSRIGDYCYYWNQYGLKDTKRGLFDQSGKMVILTSESTRQLEGILRAKKPGEVQVDMQTLSHPLTPELASLLIPSAGSSL